MLVAGHVGYEPETCAVVLAAGEARRVEFALVPRVIPMPAVTVSGEPKPREEIVTMRVVTGEDLRSRAGGFVQDPIRTLSFLPGVSHSTRGEWSGIYAVRGGDPDESKVFFGNSELLWPYHLLGFSSVINSDLVERMSFYPSVFPVRFGGALSSVTVVKPRRSRTGEGSFAYDPMNMKASYVGAVDDIDFLASVRRSFYFVQFGPMGAGRDNRPSFSDFTGQVGVPLGGQHRLQATLVSGSDHIVTNLREVYTDMAESGASVSVALESRVDGIETELAVFSNRHDFALDPAVWWGEAQTRQEETGVRFSLSAVPSDWLDVGCGVEAGRAGFTGNLQTRRGFERNDRIGSGYLSARLKPGPWVSLDLGVRYEGIRWVADRVVEPRIVLSLKPDERVTVKAGYRRSHQHPYSFLRSSGASIVFDDEYEGYEMFRDGVLGAKRADHYSLATEVEIGQLVSLSLEGYWKEYSSLPTWQLDAEEHPGEFGNSGFGFARGVELELEQRPVDGWSGRLTYGLAWCRKQQGTDTTVYWDKYDRRHSLNLSVMKEWPGSWRLSTTFHLHTGSPYTPLIHTRHRQVGTSDAYRGRSQYIIEGEKHSERIPTYHRLDFKLQKELPHLPLKPYLYVEVLNLYNHENVYHLVQFETSNGNVATGRFTGIQFIPLFGIGGRF